MVESTRHPLVLFPLLVGETSRGRKGTSWNHVRRLCAEVDPFWAQERATGGLSSAEGLINEVRDDADPPLDRRLLIVETEYASVLRVMGREGNTLSPQLRRAFDGDDLRTMTKNNPLKATGAHIGEIGHITKDELLRYLSDTEAHNGFANRLLWCCIRRSKCLPEGGRLPAEEFQSLVDSLHSVADWAKQQGQIEMRRDDAARRLWANVYPTLTTGWPGLLGAATSRAEAYTLRLSMIYAALDKSAVIRVEHLKPALATWDYAFDSARFIFGDATGDPVADRIRQELANADEGLTRTEISRLLTRHVSSTRIDQALALLARLDIAEKRKMQTDGRPIEVWIARKAN